METGRRGTRLYPKDSSRGPASSRLNSPVADLQRHRSTELSLASGRLDPGFGKACANDLALTRNPEAFKRTLPFENTKAAKAFTQNKISSELTSHWTHTLRGQRY